MGKLEMYYVTEFSGTDIDEDTDGYEVEIKENGEEQMCPECGVRGKVMRYDKNMKIYGCQKCKKYWKSELVTDWEEENNV